MADATYAQGGAYRDRDGNIKVPSGAELDIESGGALKIAGTAIAATATELNGLDLSSVEAITATSDGTGTGTISDGGLLKVVSVTSAGANNIVVLPTPTPGTIVVGFVGANGFELRTDTPASVAISGGSGSNAESAIPANTLFFAVCTSATTWLGWDLTGTTLAAIEAAS